MALFQIVELMTKTPKLVVSALKMLEHKIMKNIIDEGELPYFTPESPFYGEFQGHDLSPGGIPSVIWKPDQIHGEVQVPQISEKLPKVQIGLMDVNAGAPTHEIPVIREEMAPVPQINP